MISSRILCFGLGAAALVSFGALMPAQASTGPGTNYNYTVSFTTPNQFLAYNSGNIIFSFNPEATGAPASSVTGSNLNYSDGWQVNPFGITTFGVTSVDYFSQSVTIFNQGATNGFILPVEQWGTTFSFDLNYQDPPGPIASDFSVALQSGSTDVSLFDVQFNPGGAEVLKSAAPGVSIVSQPGTPDLSPVPEASTTVSLGLLLALGLGGMAVSVKIKAKSAC